MIPELTQQGVLPAGIHRGTLDEIELRWGTFQRSDRRPQLLIILREFVQEVKRCRWIQRLLLTGSFVTEKNEPNDIDVLLVFEQGADFIALRPHEYNVLYQAGVQRRFGPVIDLHVVEDSSEAMERWLRFFQRDRNGEPVGIVEVIL